MHQSADVKESTDVGENSCELQSGLGVYNVRCMIHQVIMACNPDNKHIWRLGGRDTPQILARIEGFLARHPQLGGGQFYRPQDILDLMVEASKKTDPAIERGFHPLSPQHPVGIPADMLVAVLREMFLYPRE